MPRFRPVARLAAAACRRTKVEFSLEEVLALNGFLADMLRQHQPRSGKLLENAVRKLNFAEARMLGKLYPDNKETP